MVNYRQQFMETSKGLVIYFFISLAFIVLTISSIAVVDGLTVKPTDGLIWRLGRDQVIVKGIVPEGPGEQAGLRENDIILGINHSLVKNPREAASILMKLKNDSRIPYLVQRGDDILTFNVTLQPYRTGDHRLLYRILVGIVFSLVGLITFLKRSAHSPARLFYLMNLCFLLVLTCSFRGSPYYWIDLIVQNAARWGLTFLGPLFLHFFLLFPSPVNFIRKYKYLIPILYVIPALRHLFFTFSQYFGGGDIGREIFGVQLELWAMLGLFLICGCLALAHSYYRTPDPMEKRQIKFILWGTIFGLSPFLAFSIIGAGIFGRSELFSIGVLPLIAIPLSFAYSIVRYRLLDIQFIVKKSILYSLLTGLFFGIYMVVVNVLGSWVDRVTPFGGGIFGILFILLIAVSFEPSRARLQTIINRFFYHADYQRQETLSKLKESLKSYTEMEDLAEATLKAIDEVFHPREITLSIITDHPTSMDVCQFLHKNRKLKKKTIHIDENSPADLQEEHLFSNNLLKSWEKNKYIGGIRNHENNRLPEYLELPIFSHDKIVGLLSLDAKTSGEAYSIQDLEALESLSDQAGLAIENIQLMQNIFEANQRLYEAEKLVSLGQLASGVAHEIRNPLSSIKLNIQGLARDLQPDMTNKRRLEIIQNEIDHLDRIVHDVLIFARPSGIQIESVSLRDLLIETLEVLTPKFKENNHRVVLNVSENIPPVSADRDKLHQACKNLIVNACDAMKNGGTLEITAGNVSTQVELTFKDSGPGIPADIINSIFNPFFTTKADGTGLGLANARKFIQEMGGELILNHEVTEGAEFIITLNRFSGKAKGQV